MGGLSDLLRAMDGGGGGEGGEGELPLLAAELEAQHCEAVGCPAANIFVHNNSFQNLSFVYIPLPAANLRAREGTVAGSRNGRMLQASSCSSSSSFSVLHFLLLLLVLVLVLVLVLLVLVLLVLLVLLLLFSSYSISRVHALLSCFSISLTVQRKPASLIKSW